LSIIPPQKGVKNQVNPLPPACPRLYLTITVINFKQILTFSEGVEKNGMIAWMLRKGAVDPAEEEIVGRGMPIPRGWALEGVI
jgi:hypothetical protein